MNGIVVEIVKTLAVLVWAGSKQSRGVTEGYDIPTTAPDRPSGATQVPISTIPAPTRATLHITDVKLPVSASEASPTPPIALPTREETRAELKLRLGKELYMVEADLRRGLKINSKPCDCLQNKHRFGIEAGAEELIPMDPDRHELYRGVIDWYNANLPKFTIEASASGKYDEEYPKMAEQVARFRKQVLGSDS